jgi:hypothetical protein
MDPAQWLGAALGLIALAVALIVIAFPTGQQWLSWPAFASFIAGIAVGNVGRWGPPNFFRHASHFDDLLSRNR